MEIRLNKLISESGICSRREADKWIESGRVTVNGKQPRIGEKITEADIVEVDGERLHISKRILQMAKELESAKSTGQPLSELQVKKAAIPHEKYGKYNKYAAARKAAKRMQEGKSDREQTGQELAMPKLGRALRRSVVAQRMVSSPKSAALRKTSRNNPTNKIKRAFGKNNQRD